jgi:TPR repeat protein
MAAAEGVLLAASGDAGVQCRAGSYFLKVHDYVAAVAFFRGAVDQGHPGGQYQLGACFFEGQGVPRDVERAAALFKLAARQGYKRAQYFLSVLYGSGVGVRRNVRKKRRWCARAAARGHARARRALRAMQGGQELPRA